ncbi:MAG: DUF6265 family protein [Pseudomonadota bacterium]
MKRLIFGLCGLFLTVNAAAEEAAPDLGWLSGHWRAEREGRVSEEIWTDAEGGLMLAVNRSVRDGRARGFEFLRIQLFGEPALYAQPGGGPATRFALVEAGAGYVVFENPDHDFPQRVLYRREGNRLTATASDLEGGNPQVFRWALKTE